MNTMPLWTPTENRNIRGNTTKMISATLSKTISVSKVILKIIKKNCISNQIC